MPLYLKSAWAGLRQAWLNPNPRPCHWDIPPDSFLWVDVILSFSPLHHGIRSRAESGLSGSAGPDASGEEWGWGRDELSPQRVFPPWNVEVLLGSPGAHKLTMGNTVPQANRHRRVRTCTEP